MKRLLAFLASLFKTRPVVGKIIRKFIDPAHNVHYNRMIPLGGSFNFLFIPTVSYTPERYFLVIETEQKKAHRIQVAFATYDRLAVGDHFNSEVDK